MVMEILTHVTLENVVSRNLFDMWEKEDRDIEEMTVRENDMVIEMVFHVSILSDLYFLETCTRNSEIGISQLLGTLEVLDVIVVV